MVSSKQQLIQLQGLVGTKALTDWETKFVKHMTELCSSKAGTTVLSSPQIETLDRIYEERCK